VTEKWQVMILALALLVVAGCLTLVFAALRTLYEGMQCLAREVKELRCRRNNDA